MMEKDRFESGKTPIVEIDNCSGNLIIRAWPESAIQAKGNYEFKELQGTWKFSAQGDLRLIVPENSSISINDISGDLLVKGVHGDISIHQAHGDAILANLRTLKLGDVYGDLVAKNVDGVINVGNVQGDAVIRSANADVVFENLYGDISAQYINGDLRFVKVFGDVSVKTINGEISIEQGLRDVNVKNIGGKLSLPDILGDIRLQGGLGAEEHILAARGDIIIRWPKGNPLSLTAKAAKIQNRLQFDEVTETTTTLIGQIGDGETIVSLTAGGRIILKESQVVDPKWEDEFVDDFNFNFVEFEDFGEKISREFNQHMDRMTAEFESKFGPEFAMRISEKVSRQAEKAARKAQQAAEKAQKYAEREAYRAQKRQQRAGWENRPPKPPQPQSPPQPSRTGQPKKQATTEEQLKILKMVENGTITPDDANNLLKALEQ